jgi:competence ComEA-like helix-hairpin-helix protein
MKKIIRVMFIFSLLFNGITYAAVFNKSYPHNKLNDTTKASKVIIHLNKATVHSLMQLKGVGKKRAKNIIAYRSSHGPFQKIDDLALVSGFSKKFINRMIVKNKNTKILI